MTEYKFCKVLNAEYKVTEKILDIYNIYFTSTYYRGHIRGKGYFN